jgi:hypothetical protein
MVKPISEQGRAFPLVQFPPCRVVGSGINADRAFAKGSLCQSWARSAAQAEPR